MSYLHQVSLDLYSGSRLLIQLIQIRLKEFNLTYPQYLTLSILWETDGILVKQIGEKLHLDSGTLTPLLKKLEAINYVKRQRGEEDERTVRVELTYPGKSLQSKVQNALEDLEKEMKDLSEEKFPALGSSLNQFLENLESLKSD
ncbi:DNA-binding MarR family transcriptional regulator [Algoriphagus iocasae]|uniref:HTH-type transcriptional regulator SarZ n=1 Tax=Algoriphagus iocasae TaxID=1836499 RepID=A0A841MEK0_9BACT|nr:MarR family transcriptional regulator [Algoriphagus iocasae]MBB6326522.1 DNA-binding MarR family transcriptional regulator [Algoriphagus iocasae]